MNNLLQACKQVEVLQKGLFEDGLSSLTLRECVCICVYDVLTVVAGPLSFTLIVSDWYSGCSISMHDSIVKLSLCTCKGIY